MISQKEIIVDLRQLPRKPTFWVGLVLGIAVVWLFNIGSFVRILALNGVTVDQATADYMTSILVYSQYLTSYFSTIVQQFSLYYLYGIGVYMMQLITFAAIGLLILVIAILVLRRNSIITGFGLGMTILSVAFYLLAWS